MNADLCVKKAGHKGSWCFFALAGFSLYAPSSPDVVRPLGCLSWAALLSSLLLHTDLALLSFVGYHWCVLERLWGWVFDHAWAVFSINLSKDKTVISYFSDSWAVMNDSTLQSPALRSFGWREVGCVGGTIVGYVPGLSGCQQPLLEDVRCALDTRSEAGEREFLTLAWHRVTLFSSIGAKIRSSYCKDTGAFLKISNDLLI